MDVFLQMFFADQERRLGYTGARAKGVVRLNAVKHTNCTSKSARAPRLVVIPKVPKIPESPKPPNPQTLNPKLTIPCAKKPWEERHVFQFQTCFSRLTVRGGLGLYQV